MIVPTRLRYLALALLLALSACQRPAPAPVAAAPKAPAVADPLDWCAPHGLPESMCTKCNPALEELFRASGDWCAGHSLPESVCPICHPLDPPTGVAAPTAGGEVTRIRFRSVEIERTAGLELVAAQRASIDLGVECTARIDFNRNRLADLRAPVRGIVREVAADLGERVQAGQPLFYLASASVGDLQSRRSGARERVGAARANLSRQEELRAKNIPSARQVELARQELETAEAELASIEQALRVSGASSGGRVGRFAVASPLAGTVVRRPALVGTFASESESLATVADTSTMWAMLDVNEFDASSVSISQPVSVRVDGVPDRIFRGLVSWVASEVNPRTRTVAVRAEVKNQDGLLRANQFARATIQIAAADGALAVPLEAVQELADDGSVVFVRTGALSYEPRSVHLGRSDGSQVHILGELEAGDPVVTTGAFLLKTELMRGSIGAGCCYVETAGVN